MIRYKVVRIRDNKMYSCSAPGNYCLEYKIGEEVHSEPETVGLLCFDCLDNTIKFFDHRDNLEDYKLLEVETFGELEEVPICCCSYDEGAYNNFYRHIDNHYNSIAPWGTVFCQSLKVIQEVEL